MQSAFCPRVGSWQQPTWSGVMRLQMLQTQLPVGMTLKTLAACSTGSLHACLAIYKCPTPQTVARHCVRNVSGSFYFALGSGHYGSHELGKSCDVP
eukprot:4483368-Amphidinium_carterae.1